MEYYLANSLDIAVIGAGHAGIEAALAAARLGLNTAIFTISLDSIGAMPCNPSIGGSAKGQLVRELDCLGGEMPHAADATSIQSRMLGLGKGPAVHSLRAQCDKWAYHRYMRKALENQKNLLIKQAEVTEIVIKDNTVAGLRTAMGAFYAAKCVIIATGTFLGGRVFVGEYSENSGPDGLHPALKLEENLKALGIELRRFKTGTPARVRRSSIDFSKLEMQLGDEPPIPFSLQTPLSQVKNILPCYITYTNEKTHEIIRSAMHRSPLFSGEITGVGPRYCPSIEDKVRRFPTRTRHQLFLEPMGLDTEEVYVQGFSSSLPEEIQVEMYRSVEGLEKAQLMRTAYAIEYACIDPLLLFPTLEFKKISGLFGAGQFCGTSGYEEAAVQGFVAGVNAAHKLLNKAALILPRYSSYIGTLIDDLVTKGCSDPYRMMTSRSEYRLLLRQDNADTRLLKIGYDIGLISNSRYEKFLDEQNQKSQELKRLKNLTVSMCDAVNNFLISKGTAPLFQSIKCSELLKRPQIKYSELPKIGIDIPNLSIHLTQQIENELKYSGYIKNQLDEIENTKKYHNRSLSHISDFATIPNLSLEAIDKLNKIRPVDIGQAERISGITPADITALILYSISE